MREAAVPGDEALAGADGSSGPPAPPDRPEALEGWATLGTGEEARLASLLARACANMFDTWAVLAVSAAFIVLMTTAWPELRGEPADVWILLPVFVVVGGVYDVAWTAARGQTPAMKFTEIRVIRADDGQTPTLGESLRRFLVSFGSVPVVEQVVALVVCAPIIWDRAQRGLHDKVAGTLVVHASPFDAVHRLDESEMRAGYLLRPEDGHAFTSGAYGFSGILLPFIGLPLGVAGLLLGVEAIKRLPPKGQRPAGVIRRRRTLRGRWRVLRTGEGFTKSDHIRRRVRYAYAGLWMSIAATALQSLLWGYVIGGWLGAWGPPP